MIWEIALGVNFSNGTYATYLSMRLFHFAWNDRVIFSQNLAIKKKKMYFFYINVKLTN